MNDLDRDPINSFLHATREAIWQLTHQAAHGNGWAVGKLLWIACLFLNPFVVSSSFQGFGLPYPQWYPAAWISLFLGLIGVAYFSWTRRPIDKPSLATIRPTAARGLLSYTEADSALFLRLGRSSKLRELTTLINRADFRFGVVTGVSGSGKTSFVRAGLIPWLNQDGSGYVGIYVKCSDAHPTHLFEAALRQTALDAVSSDVKAIGFLQRLQSASTIEYVVVFDQFEQFFVHHDTPTGRQRFIETLRDIWALPAPVKVIVSVREDFVGRLIRLEPELPHPLLHHSVSIQRFEIEEAVGILSLLSSEDDVPFDEGSIRELLERDLSDDQGRVSPVDLQMLAWMVSTQTAPRDRQLTASTLNQLGGVDGLLGFFLQTIVGVLPNPEDRRLAVDVLVALTDFANDTRAGALTARQVSERLSNPASPADTERLLKWLSRPEIRLVVDHYEDKETQYELAHERLIVSLRQATESSSARIDKARYLIASRTSLWLSSGRRRQQLLTLREWRSVSSTGRLFRQIESAPQREFLRASETRNRQFLYRCLALGLAVGIGWLVSQSPWQVRRSALAQLRAEFAKGSNEVPGDAALALFLAGDFEAATSVGLRSVTSSHEFVDAVADRARTTGDWSQLRALAANVNASDAAGATAMRERLLYNVQKLGGSGAGVANILAESWSGVADESSARLDWEYFREAKIDPGTLALEEAIKGKKPVDRPKAWLEAIDMFASGRDTSGVSELLAALIVSADAVTNEDDASVFSYNLAQSLKRLLENSVRINASDIARLRELAAMREDANIRVLLALFLHNLSPTSDFLATFRKATQFSDEREYLRAVSRVVTLDLDAGVAESKKEMWAVLSTEVLRLVDSPERSSALLGLARAGGEELALRIVQGLTKAEQHPTWARPDWFNHVAVFVGIAPQPVLAAFLPILNSNTGSVADWEDTCTSFVRALTPISAETYAAALKVLDRIELELSRSRCIVRLLDKATALLAKEWDSDLARSIAAERQVGSSGDAAQIYDAVVAILELEDASIEDVNALEDGLRELVVTPIRVFFQNARRTNLESQEAAAVGAALAAVYFRTPDAPRLLQALARDSNGGTSQVLEHAAQALIDFGAKTNNAGAVRTAVAIGGSSSYFLRNAAVALCNIAVKNRDYEAVGEAIGILGRVSDIYNRSDAGREIATALIRATEPSNPAFLFLAADAATASRSYSAYGVVVWAAWYGGHGSLAGRLLTQATASYLQGTDMYGLYQLIDVAADMGRWSTALLIARSPATRLSVSAALAHLLVRWEIMNRAEDLASAHRAHG